MRLPQYKAWITTAWVASLLASCAPLDQPTPPALATPAPITPAAALPAPQRSASSIALERYYGNLQADLLAQGLLRTDGGGPDTPYSADMLVRNFEAIAFYDEYVLGGWAPRQDNTPVALRRWHSPIRMSVAFGPSVPQAQRGLDRTNIRLFGERLQRITGHSITATAKNANFHVMIMGEDDREDLLSQVRQIVPELNQASINILSNIPRSTHCLMLGYSASENVSEIRRAVVVIRAEHPGILRKSCIHEELSQGLGLVNDSPEARPSIFNDDDEFALLTSHDESLLAMLYDRRLKSGITLAQAQPIIRELAAEQMAKGF